MPRSLLLTALLFLACARRYPAREVAGPLAAARVTVTPRLLTAPAAVLFWLPGADTLGRADAAEAWDAVLAEARLLREITSGSDVRIVGTHAPQLYVVGPGGNRRTVMLSGLDYPWGVVLVDPGYPEEIVTGPIDADELEDLAWDYFRLGDAGRRGATLLSFFPPFLSRPP